VVHLIAIDPSGNFLSKEGKGTTGWASFDSDGSLMNYGDVRAKEYDTTENYWGAIISKIMAAHPKIIVCESYQLQPGKAMAQSWSDLETPQLIGAIRHIAWSKNVKFIFQPPSIKPRFADHILVRMGIAETKNNKIFMVQGMRSNDHQRDAIRHGLYYFKYGVKK